MRNFSRVALVYSALIFIYFSTANAESESYYEKFLQRYSENIKLETQKTKKDFTDQQLAKIGVIKDYSALTQGRLYLVADKQLEALNEYKQILIMRQLEGFDQSITISKISNLENLIVTIIQRIDGLDQVYEKLEFSDYESIRPLYNTILTDSADISSRLEDTNTQIFDLINENL